MTPKPTSPVTSTRAGEEMIQADSSASEKVCDHPSTEKAAWLLLPRALTAENGAKAALIGEFSEEYGVCADQFAKVPVSWTTIKAIWKAAVAHFEAAPPDGQVIAHPANSLRSSPESSEPSLLGRETVREETIEECATIADRLRAYDPGSEKNYGKAIRSLSPLKESQ